MTTKYILKKLKCSDHGVITIKKVELTQEELEQICSLQVVCNPHFDKHNSAVKKIKELL